MELWINRVRINRPNLYKDWWFTLNRIGLLLQLLNWKQRDNKRMSHDSFKLQNTSYHIFTNIHMINNTIAKQDKFATSIYRIQYSLQVLLSTQGDLLLRLKGWTDRKNPKEMSLLERTLQHLHSLDESKMAGSTGTYGSLGYSLGQRKADIVSEYQLLWWKQANWQI